MEFLDLTVEQLASGYIETELLMNVYTVISRLLKQKFIIIMISFIQL